MCLIYHLTSSTENSTEVEEDRHVTNDHQFSADDMETLTTSVQRFFNLLGVMIDDNECDHLRFLKLIKQVREPDCSVIG